MASNSSAGSGGIGCPVSPEFWHLASFGPAGRVAFYREQEAAGGC